MEAAIWYISKQLAAGSMVGLPNHGWIQICSTAAAKNKYLCPISEPSESK